MKHAVLAIGVAAWLACTATAAPGHYEERTYVGPSTAVSGCFADTAPGVLGVVCFGVMPGEANAALRIRDAGLMQPIGALVRFNDITGNPMLPTLQFCGQTSFAIPAGAAYVEVDIYALAPPLTACATHVPTTGIVMGTLW